MRIFALMRLSILVVAGAVVATGLLAHPGSAIAVGDDGRVFFVDTGGGLFSIERDGRLVRHQGPAFHWFAFDPKSRFQDTRWPHISGAQIRSVGRNPTLVLSSDFPVTIGSDGKFYYPSPTDGGGIRIVGIDPAGTTSARATLPPARAGETARWVNGLTARPDGSLYFTEDAAVKRIDAGGAVTVVLAGITVPACVAIPGIEAEARPYLRGIAVAADGSVYVAASGCGAVLKIDPRGKSSVVLRTTAPWSPTAVAIARGDIYVLEYLHTASDERREWIPRVRKVSNKGVITTLATNNRR